MRTKEALNSRVPGFAACERNLLPEACMFCVFAFALIGCMALSRAFRSRELNLLPPRNVDLRFWEWCVYPLPQAADVA